ncbi:MAG TPA: DUF4268 domain-containing protein [Candidatus Jeotgalibaca pullicola]|nr:DUF4268 domain-containing protein [Candidatus Jeotgalibaca pullicola]
MNSIEQIIPITDAEEYLIKVANKKQEEIKTKEQKQTIVTVRKEFWAQLLEAMNRKSHLFSNVNPTKDNWLGCGSGHSGISYQFVVTGSYVRVELWIIGRSQAENKKIFDKLYEQKNKIEEKFEGQLGWQRLDEGKESRVSYSLYDVGISNKEDWEEMISFAVSYMIKLEQAIKKELQSVMRSL